jgi:hypothetical protein
MHLGIVQVRLLLLLLAVFWPLLLLSLLGLKVNVVSVSVLVLQKDVARCFTHEVWTRAVVVQSVVVVSDRVVEELYRSILLLLYHRISHLLLGDPSREDILLVWGRGGLFEACS